MRMRIIYRYRLKARGSALPEDSNRLRTVVGGPERVRLMAARLSQKTDAGSRFHPMPTTRGRAATVAFPPLLPEKAAGDLDYSHHSHSQSWPSCGKTYHSPQKPALLLTLLNAFHTFLHPSRYLLQTPTSSDQRRRAETMHFLAGNRIGRAHGARWHR